MSTTDRLYFPPTGEETSYYVLVTVARNGEDLAGRVSIEKPKQLPEGSEQPPAYPERTGDLVVIMREAGEFATLRGYPLRVVKPAGIEFPAELGTYAERQIDE